VELLAIEKVVAIGIDCTSTATMHAAATVDWEAKVVAYHQVKIG
jgi:hypothetical protein